MAKPSIAQQPPDFSTYGKEAEQAYLGLVLMDNKVLTDFPLLPEDFYSNANKLIHESMIEIASKRQTIDLVTLTDHLGRRRKLEQAGGPVWLARLTDGLPPFGGAGKDYARIIKEWKEKRAMYQAGISLQTASQSLVPPDDAYALIEEELQKVKPQSAEDKKAKLRFHNYPTLPRLVWYGPCELYRRAMEKSTNASPSYHLACFLTITGAMLGKSVLTEEGGDEIYPNLFTVVVGEAGWAKKDTAVNRSIQVLKSIDKEVVRLSGIASVQGFLLEMQSEQKELEDAKVDGPLRVLIRLREFHTLINTAAQKATSNIWPTLCEFYDCPEEMKNPTVGKPLRVREPVGSMLGASSPGWLKSLNTETLAAGPGSRIVWVPGDPGVRIKRREKPDKHYLIPLSEKLAERVSFYRRAGRTVFELSADAQDRMDEWGQAVEDKRSGNELIDMITARDEATCRKVALIHAALDASDEIKIHHLEAAIAFVEFLWECRFPLFAQHGMTPTAELEEKILSRVRSAMPLGLAYRDIRRGIQRPSYEQFERAIKSLTMGADPPIRVGKVGSRPWVWENI